jgi:predicted nucleic acid-binding protein
MIAPVFVDANVLIYVHDARVPAKQSAAIAWIEHVWDKEIGRTSVQVLSEFYTTVTRKLKPGLTQDDAWRQVELLLAWKPQQIDAILIRRAREVEQRYRLSWWDSMVVAAAQLQDCALLLSEDLQDGAAFGAVTVRSPFKLSVDEPRAVYEVPAVASRHPPRGRPRKQLAVR